MRLLNYTGAEKLVNNRERLKTWVSAPVCDPHGNYYGSSSIVLQREILL